ncbi:hypothetical protein LHYA1_G002367 [Lachnellula hyalina]|uniref:Uncharacterized protein n=1 Tax=Lachnellula hyalina TaxID=1316788 RepID=A0A8H8R8C3_9HELO|nr:uncharacterized protein LHYA1_G002367 [Lachnellula hyalina]TVY28654.1 hypothetical protein LHYA1_G002367 [Lachnellula hyalina]
MSVVKDGCVVRARPTAELSRLVELAASDIRNEMSNSQGELISKLRYTQSCRDVQREFTDSYQNTIRPESVTATIFHPHNIQTRWIPEVFLLKDGAFEIPRHSVAVAIPLINDGHPTIEYHDYKDGSISQIEWTVGSVIFLVGDASVALDGPGATGFILLLFGLRQNA